MEREGGDGAMRKMGSRNLRKINECICIPIVRKELDVIVYVPSTSTDGFEMRWYMSHTEGEVL